MIRQQLSLQDGSGIKVLTYNVLAQSLVRREQYPTSGKFLRWDRRSKAFSHEFNAYDPDLVVMQEIDVQHLSFWSDLLSNRGYAHIFYSHTKKHGLVIAYKSQSYALENHHKLDLDTLEVQEIPRQCETGNIALFAEFKSTTGANFLLGTSHFYWHPKASYERSRQFLCLLNWIAAHKDPQHTCILAGDFNTEYFDPPYLLATGNFEAAARRQAADIMHASISTPTFDKLGPTVVRPESSATNGASQTTATKSHLAGLDDPRRAEKLTAAMITAFRDHTLVCKSMYAEYYRVRGDNADEISGEPLFTNWTEGFKGTLDYIFEVQVKNTPANTNVLKLLDLPNRDQLTGGLPRLGISPSDHFCIMAEIEQRAHVIG